MNPKLISLIALLAVPCLAQPGPWQIALGLNRQSSTSLGVTGSSVNLKRTSSTAPALQAGYRTWDLGSSDLSVTAEYQGKTGSDLNLTAGQLGAGNIGTFKTSFLAPGVSWNFHQAVDWGLGLQYRFEQLNGVLFVTDNTVSARYNRPWYNVYIGYTFKMEARAQPYVALRLSGAFSSIDSVNLNSLGTTAGNTQLLRSLDADSELSLQVGLRF